MQHLEHFLAARRADIAAHLHSRIGLDRDLIDDAIQDACVTALVKAADDPSLDGPRIVRLFWSLVRRAGQHVRRQEQRFLRYLHGGFDPMVLHHPNALYRTMMARARSAYCQRGHLLDGLEKDGSRYCKTCAKMAQERIGKDELRRRGKAYKRAYLARLGAEEVRRRNLLYHARKRAKREAARKEQLSREFANENRDPARDRMPPRFPPGHGVRRDADARGELGL